MPYTFASIDFSMPPHLCVRILGPTSISHIFNWWLTHSLHWWHYQLLCSAPRAHCHLLSAPYFYFYYGAVASYVLFLAGVATPRPSGLLDVFALWYFRRWQGQAFSFLFKLLHYIGLLSFRNFDYYLQLALIPPFYAVLVFFAHYTFAPAARSKRRSVIFILSERYFSFLILRFWYMLAAFLTCISHGQKSQFHTYTDYISLLIMLKPGISRYLIAFDNTFSLFHFHCIDISHSYYYLFFRFSPPLRKMPSFLKYFKCRSYILLSRLSVSIAQSRPLTTTEISQPHHIWIRAIFIWARLREVRPATLALI